MKGYFVEVKGSWEDFKRMTDEFVRSLGNKKVHFIGMGFGGSRDLEYFERALEKMNFPSANYSRTDATMSHEANRTANRKDYMGEYRSIRFPKGFNVPDNVEAYVCFEDRATNTGISAASGPINILYRMHHGNIPSNNTTPVYLFTTADSLGISHLSNLSFFEDYLGLPDFIRLNMPVTYFDLRSKALINQIGERLESDLHDMRAYNPNEYIFRLPLIPIKILIPRVSRAERSHLDSHQMASLMGELYEKTG